MVTNKIDHWADCIRTAIEDSNLNVWHLSLLLALAHLAFLQNEDLIIHASRSRIMKLSHINTLPTYHKYFKQLQSYGYIKYIPSYHPGYRSTVELTLNSKIKGGY